MSDFKKKPRISIIDTGTSNLRSVFYALKKNNCEPVIITHDKDYDENTDGLVVPGVGSFLSVMNHLKKNELDKTIYKAIQKNKLSMFICVGMQILFSESQEFGYHKGLGIFDGKIKKIPSNINEQNKRNVPMIGWNKIKIFKDDYILNNQNDSFFYFTHSFYAEPDDTKIITSKASYLNFEYCSSISNNKIFAFQFHPEKSGEKGVRIYKRFIELV
ncbi:imidazole glycerol phosphate synthase subunit HisH [Candidatus Pelagibacter sp.]|nr:imidazole glycerol phosphate synthase subunit HisH [Candidatus Pelagibacter sp.]